MEELLRHGRFLEQFLVKFLEVHLETFQKEILEEFLKRFPGSTTDHGPYKFFKNMYGGVGLFRISRKITTVYDRGYLE